MNIKLRLTVLSFLQFFIWGSWLISLGGYMFSLGFTGTQVSVTYGTMGIASLFMPALLGIVADRWINAERVLGVCHIIGAGLLLWASTVTDFKTMYLIMLLNSMMYMPTIALVNTVSYVALEKNSFDIVKTFPPIRVWGTVGFICAMWVTDLNKWTLSPNQLYVSAIASVIMGIYSFTVTKCPPVKTREKKTFVSSLGLDAFVLFKRKQMLVFFLFAMFLGAALQITNTFGVSFLNDFKKIYPDSFAVKHPNVLLSISQISETLFGFAFLVLSMIVYGMAFDFFNISGSLFVEREADVKIRASAQGLFMLMTNGLGAALGGLLSGRVVDYFTANGVKDWKNIWFSFAGYALVIGIIFPLVFRYKHTPTASEIGKAEAIEMTPH